MKLGHAESVQLKPHQVLTPVLPVTKIRAIDGSEMFKSYTQQSYQLLTICNGGNRTRHTIGLDIDH